MKLDRDQRIRMSLGATTGLPSPFPTIGVVKLERTSKPDDDTLVHITNAKSHNQAVTWSVRLGDVGAFETKKKVDQKKPSQWHVSRREIVKAIKKGGKKGRKGIVYVREEAQVLLSLEYGLSAINSADVAALGGVVPKERTSDEDFATMCVRCP